MYGIDDVTAYDSRQYYEKTDINSDLYDTSEETNYVNDRKAKTPPDHKFEDFNYLSTTNIGRLDELREMSNLKKVWGSGIKHISIIKSEEEKNSQQMDSSCLDDIYQF